MTVIGRELIVYATPTGVLAEACERFWATVPTTTAQTYPPHVTLTGFFERATERIPTVVDDLDAAVASTRACDLIPRATPHGPISHEGDTAKGHEPWIGLEIVSPWLARLIGELVARHRPLDGEAALRPKEWLHLSLAYGTPPALIEHEQTATTLLPQAVSAPGAATSWELGLWERTAATTSGTPTWTRHAEWPLSESRAPGIRRRGPRHPR